MNNVFDMVPLMAGRWSSLALLAAPAAGSPNLIRTLVPLAVVILVMYYILIYPQRKKQKEHQKMLSELKKNDRVVTVGGVHGIVKSVGDKEVVLVVDDSNKIKMTFSREAVSRIIRTEEDEKEKT